jgi:prepilin-type N-terminal cleavage/methylation domain-containing protein
MRSSLPKIAVVARERLSRRDGMTLVEVLVAALILVIAALALFKTFDKSRTLMSDSEMRNTATALARGEIERVEGLPWSSIAASAPSKAEGATNPTHYVSEGPCAGSSNPPVNKPCYQWDWTKGSSTEPFVVSAGADATSNPNPWSDAISTTNASVRASGSIYRFITWVNDGECKAAECGGEKDAKRITVAVTSSWLKTPVVLSTVYWNPAGESANPLKKISELKCLDGGVKVACTN